MKNRTKILIGAGILSVLIAYYFKTKKDKTILDKIFDKKNVIELEGKMVKGTSKLSPSTYLLIDEYKSNRQSKNNLVRIILKYKEGCRSMLDDPIFKNVNIMGNSNIATVSIKKSNLEKLEQFECLIYADGGGKMRSLSSLQK